MCFAVLYLHEKCGSGKTCGMKKCGTGKYGGPASTMVFMFCAVPDHDSRPFTADVRAPPSCLASPAREVQVVTGELRSPGTRQGRCSRLESGVFVEPGLARWLLLERARLPVRYGIPPVVLGQTSVRNKQTGRAEERGDVTLYFRSDFRQAEGARSRLRAYTGRAGRAARRTGKVAQSCLARTRCIRRRITAERETEVLPGL